MIILLVFLMALMAWLWYWGGGKNAWMRDILIPIIIGVFFCFKYGIIVGILTAGSCQIIRQGYGAWDPEHDDKPSFWAKVTHDRNGWWIRAIVGAEHGLIAPAIVFNYLAFFKHQTGIVWWYLIFIALNAVSNFLVSRLKLNRLATDLIVGSVFALILIF